MSQRNRLHSLGIALLAGLLLSIVTTGVGARSARAQNAHVTLLVWDEATGGGEAKAVNQIYANFMKLHPNITIKHEAFTTDQLRQTEKTALGSGTGPDLLESSPGPGWAGDLARSGLISPLTRIAATYQWNTRIVKAALQGATINGVLYGVPTQIDMIGLYYNKTLIAKAGLTVPQTQAQLVTFCQQAKAKGYIPMAFGDDPGWEAYHTFSMIANNTAGVNVMRKLLTYHQGSWNTPQFVKAITLYFVDLQRAGCFSSGVTGVQYTDANALFDTGKALLNPTGSWIANEVAGDKFDMGMMPYPAVNGHRVWVSGVGAAYYLSSKTAHPKEARMLLDYLISPPSTKIWEEVANVIVPVQFDTRSLKVAPLVRSLFNQVQAAIHGTANFGFNIDVLTGDKFNTAMSNDFQAVLNGQETPQQAADHLQAAWQQGLKIIK